MQVFRSIQDDDLVRSIVAAYQASGLCGAWRVCCRGSLRTPTRAIVSDNQSTKPAPRCAQLGTAFQASRIRPCSESAAGSKCRKCIQNRSE